jgi:hypothetical protein
MIRAALGSEVTMRSLVSLSGVLLALGMVLGLAAPAAADVIEGEAVIIVAAPQRPNAFYVLERTRHRAEVRDTRASFTDEIARDAARLDATSGAN